MSCPVLRPFSPHDLEMLVNRDGDHDLSTTILAQARSGIALTAEVDGVPIGCGGLVIPWDGMGLCWMLLGESICRYPVWLTRTVRRLLHDVERACDLQRVEALVLESAPRNQRWLEQLGFTTEREGLARAYLPGHLNVIRYERVKGLGCKPQP